MHDTNLSSDNYALYTESITSNVKSKYLLGKRVRDEGLQYDTNMEIIRICSSFNAKNNRSLLCLNDTYEIATYNGENYLNKRREIIHNCRHRGKYKLVNCEIID